MPVYEWQGHGDFHDNRNDRTISPGEQVELASEVADPHPEFTKPADTPTTDSEDSGSLPHPSDYSVSEFTDEFSISEFSDDERETMAENERAGKDRASMLERLEP